MWPVYSVLTEETLEMGQGGRLGEKDEGRAPPGGAGHSSPESLALFVYASGDKRDSPHPMTLRRPLGWGRGIPGHSI